MKLVGFILIIGLPVLICIVIPMLALNHIDKHNPPDPRMW